VSAQEAADLSREPNWWEERVWYLLFVRSFYDSDGDGMGDIQGIIEKLDYLNDGDPNTTDDLGITGIWLLPIMESNAYHGYWTTDFFSVESDYGTMEDFQQLMDEAHARGIAVIIDYVYNHVSTEHPWFQSAVAGDETFEDYFIWEEENPGYNGPWGATTWWRNSTNDLWYYSPFDSALADLNHTNPAVTEEMNEIARFWLEDVGVDGFRMDAIRYVIEIEVDGRPILADSPTNREYLAQFNAFVNEVSPDAFTVGEIFVNSSNTISRYVEDGAVDAAFEFALAEEIIGAAQLGNKRNIERQLATTLRELAPGTFMNFSTNHDQPRLLTLLGEDEGQNRVVANLLMTLPGAPFIYYGEEIGMTGTNATEDDRQIRRPLPWDESENHGFTTGTPWFPLEEDADIRNIARQIDNPDSLLSHYRSLIHLRNSQPALQYGATIPVDSSYRAAWGYLRSTDEETLLVVLNLDDRETTPYTFAVESSPLTSVSSVDVLYATSEITTNLPELTETGGFTEYTPINETLPPYSIYVLRLNP
ncbi:MAG: alpha-amylase family glycosyl hydrolase, partial [Chloroflexota bacterium]